MNAIERMTNNSDRAKVNAWMDHIKESDSAIRKEVLDNCAKDKAYRAYFVAQYDRYIGESE